MRVKAADSIFGGTLWYRLAPQQRLGGRHFHNLTSQLLQIPLAPCSAARRWSIPVVHCEWLEKTIATGALIPIAGYRTESYPTGPGDAKSGQSDSHAAAPVRHTADL